MKERSADLFDVISSQDESLKSYRAAVRDALEGLPVSLGESSARKQPSFSNFVTSKRRITGEVTSAKMNKTIVVKIERQKVHPFYGKVVRNNKKFYAHDEHNLAQEGDIVQIVETRPLSKTKRWLLEAVVRRPSLKGSTPRWLRMAPLIRLSMPELQEHQALVKGRGYQVCIEFEEEQFKLFGEQLPVLEAKSSDGISNNLDGDKANAPVGYELTARLGGPGFKTEPAAVSIKAVTSGPAIEPRSVLIMPLASGILEFYVSVVLQSSGELIQRDVFQFTVQ